MATINNDFKVKNGLVVGTTATILSNATAISTTTGALTVSGGAGVGGDLYVGGIGYVGGKIVVTTATNYAVRILNTASSTVTNVANSLYLAGGLWVDKDLSIGGNISGTTATVTQVIGNSGQFFGDENGHKALYAGIPIGFTVIENAVTQFTGSINDSSQINFQNINNGEKGSTDLILTGSAGTNLKNYLDLGQASGTWDGSQSNSIGTMVGPNDGYLYVQGNSDVIGQGNLVLGASSFGSVVKIFAGGSGASALVVTVNSATTQAISTLTGALVVKGGVGIGGNIHVGGTIYGTFNGALSGTATTATNIYAGSAGQIPYQTGFSQTTFTGPGNAGNVLVSRGSGGPVFQNTLTLSSTLYNTGTSTASNALYVAGGVGASYLNLANEGWINGSEIVTTATLGSSFGAGGVQNPINITNTGSNAFTVIGGAIIGGNLLIGGNVQFNGTVTSINSSAVDIGSKLIYLSTLSNTALEAYGSGIIIGTDPNNSTVTNTWASLTFDGTVPGNWVMGNGLLPGSTLTYNIGSQLFRWSTVYANTVTATNLYDSANRVITQVTPSGSNYIGISNLTSSGPTASFTINNLGVTNLTSGTDITLSATTGSITVNNVSTLQSVTGRGATTTNAISITNATASVSTVSGALTVVGGVGIQGSVYAGTIFSNGNQVLTSGGGGGGGYVSSIIGGTDISVNTATGAVTISDTSTLQSVTGRGATTNNVVKITNTTTSVDTTSGALVVSGGLGVGGAIYAASTSYIGTGTILTSVDLQTVTYPAGYITNDPTSQAGLSTLAGTSTSYGTYNFGTVTDIRTFNDYNTATNTGFYSINDAAGAPGYIVYTGFPNITDFNRVVLNINYTQNSGHTVTVDLYNHQTLSWDSLTSYSGSVGWYQLALAIIDAAPYISSGTVTLRVYHVSSGSPSHRTWIDYIALENSIQGGQGPRGSTGATGATGPQGLTTTTTSTFIFSNTTNSTGTNSGAVVVYGGVGIGKSLYAAQIYDDSNRVVTSVVPSSGPGIGITNLVSIGTATSFTILNTGVQTLTAGTDTQVSSSTGTVTVWNNSTLQTVTDRGATTTNAISITNATASNGTTTGALTVVGGAGIQGSVYAGNMYSNGSQVITQGTIGSQGVTGITAGPGIQVNTSTGNVTVTNIGTTATLGSTYIGVSANTGAVTITNLGVQTLTAGTDTRVSSSTGTVTVWNESTLQTITGRGATTNNAVTLTNTLAVTGQTTLGAVTATNLVVNGTIQHNGLVLTNGLNIDQVYSTSTTITLTTNWQDTDVDAAELATGSYMVQCTANDSGVGGNEVNTYYTGIMSWYSNGNTENSYDEITLHRAGAVSGSGAIFLQVLRTNGGFTKLQIAGTTNNSGPSTYALKFRRMI